MNMTNVELAEMLREVKGERDALSRRLAMIELAWDRCEGVPSLDDRRELHRLIIDTEPHVDAELADLRRQAEEAP